MLNKNEWLHDNIHSHLMTWRDGYSYSLSLSLFSIHLLDSELLFSCWWRYFNLNAGWRSLLSLSHSMDKWMYVCGWWCEKGREDESFFLYVVKIFNICITCYAVLRMMLPQCFLFDLVYDECILLQHDKNRESKNHHKASKALFNNCVELVKTGTLNVINKSSKRQ